MDIIITFAAKDIAEYACALDMLNEFLTKHPNLTLAGKDEPQVARASQHGTGASPTPPTQPEAGAFLGKELPASQTTLPTRENTQPPASVQEERGAPKQPPAQPGSGPTPLPEQGPACPKHGTHMRLHLRPQRDGTHYYCPVPVGTDPKTKKTRFCKERM